VRALNVVVVITLWIVVVALFVFGIARMACAQYDERTALALVQCLRAECDECDRNPEEPAAIAWVLKKTAKVRGVSLHKQITGYCALFNRHNDRARAIVASTFEEPKNGSKQWWLEMRIWARLFLLGQIPDPLEKACHWGGGTDVYRMKGRRLVGSYCNRRNKKCNHFWSKK